MLLSPWDLWGLSLSTPRLSAWEASYIRRAGKLRKALSQKRLAAKFGIGVYAVRHYEQGRHASKYSKVREEAL